MTMAQPTAMFAPLAFLLLCWKLAGVLIRHYFTHKTTVLLDLPKLGKARQDHLRISGTAVVIGGSIAGLWAARVCADHFEDVLVVEPEAWTAQEKGTEPIYDENGDPKDGTVVHSRHRVMQYISAHGYQPIQLHALRRLLPDFEEEVRKADGRILPHEYNVAAFGGHILRPPFSEYEDKKELDGLFMTRESYERLLRRLVRKSSTRIRWLAGTATGLKATRNSPTIDSVIVHTDSGTEREIPASFVVGKYCSGPSHAGLKWLMRLYKAGATPTKLGSLPFEDLKLEYKILRRYRVFRIHVPSSSRARLPIPGGYDNVGVIFCYYPSAGKDICKLVVNRVEGHRIEFVFIGWSGPPIPTSIHEIKDYWFHINAVEPMPKWLFDMLDILLENKGPVEYTDVVFPPLSWVRYEDAPYLPSNFIAIGDAVMRANPANGQGCSKAAMGAVIMNSMLRTLRHDASAEIPENFSYAFFKRQSDILADIWYGTKAIDYRSPTTIPVKGEKLSEGYFTATYKAIVTQLSVKDDQVNATLWKVGCLLAPPIDLYHPIILAKVAFFWVRQQLGIA